jgi:hypothetical protein
MHKGLAVAGVGAALASSVVVAGPASAAQEQVVLHCPGQTLTVTVASTTSENSKNYFSAARIQGGGVLLPYVLTFTGMDPGGVVVFQETYTKPAPLPDNAITCTFSQQVPGMGTFSGVVTGVIRGR